MHDDSPSPSDPLAGFETDPERLAEVVQGLPHRPPMHLLDECVAASMDEIRFRTRVRRGGAFADARGVHAMASLELFAQASAALLGYRDLGSGRSVQAGLLLGVREATFDIHELEFDRICDVRVYFEWGGGANAKFRCELRFEGDDTVYARANITVRSVDASAESSASG